MTMTERRVLVVQKWEESERGWGTRPDGYTLHLSEADRLAFIRAYWARMPDEVPDEYSRPDGAPYLWDADEEAYREVLGSERGVWKSGRPPGSQGSGGWKSVSLA